ncbi:MAG: hypothetical protein P9L99_16735 [Candidatus Lernaella stagnicola]|nr:hypothetical protein [Candidatus Lernaella stagnicola]
MSLFDDPIQEVLAFVEEARERGALHESASDSARPWPARRTLVLQDDTRFELGKPSAESVFALMWSERLPIGHNRVWRVGPELRDLPPSGAGFALIPLALVEPATSTIELFTNLRDAFHRLELDGLMVRVLPGQQTIWCRVHRDANLDECGFHAWGAALIQQLSAVPGVRGVDVLFVSDDPPSLSCLAAPARRAGRIGGAILKLASEPIMECDGCEFADLCRSVAELKRIRAAGLKREAHG